MSLVLGANLPWVRYGGDFGANAWSPDGGLATRKADRQRVLDVLLRLREAGVTQLRWFFLCDARAGIRFRDDGAPLEIQSEAWRDIDAALDLVRRADLSLMPVLFDFHLCRPRRIVNGVQTGGRSRFISHADLRARLLDNIVGPLLANYGHSPEIGAWDLFNEPEWATFGVGTWNPVSSVSKAAMRGFLHAAAARAHALTRQKVTVGTASALTLSLVRGLGLDFYQPHWYDRFETRAPLGRHTATLDCDGPVVLGEFPTCNSARTPAELLDTAQQSGYAAAYFWSALADDGFTHLQQATAAVAGRTPATPHS
ncbi:MAG: hypothetical protein JJE40_04280 [Vicinamibacteria bacterium]|nr:hypothetical protein [Vicinamibacteria bacterium]